MLSGRVLAEIINDVRPISDEQKTRIIDFLIDLSRADDLVERIASQKDQSIRRELFDLSRIFIRKYKAMGYAEVYRLFYADLKWNRRKTVQDSIELSRAIYSFIVKNITGFYDRQVESLIIASNLLDDFFDMRKDNTLSFNYAFNLILSTLKYTILAFPLIIRNIFRIYQLIYLTKFVIEGGFDDELYKTIYLKPEYNNYEDHYWNRGFGKDQFDDKNGK